MDTTLQKLLAQATAYEEDPKTGLPKNEGADISRQEFAGIMAKIAEFKKSSDPKVRAEAQKYENYLNSVAGQTAKLFKDNNNMALYQQKIKDDKALQKQIMAEKNPSTVQKFFDWISGVDTDKRNKELDERYEIGNNGLKWDKYMADKPKNIVVTGDIFNSDANREARKQAGLE